MVVFYPFSTNQVSNSLANTRQANLIADLSLLTSIASLLRVCLPSNKASLIPERLCLGVSVKPFSYILPFCITS